MWTCRCHQKVTASFHLPAVTDLSTGIVCLLHQLYKLGTLGCDYFELIKKTSMLWCIISLGLYQYYILMYAEPLKYLMYRPCSCFMKLQLLDLQYHSLIQIKYNVLISLMRTCFPPMRFVVFRMLRMKLSSAVCHHLQGRRNTLQIDTVYIKGTFSLSWNLSCWMCLCKGFPKILTWMESCVVQTLYDASSK